MPHRAEFLEEAVVHGNSMGGLLSVLLAAAHPARVERLVLTSPALPPPRTSPVASSAAAVRFAPFLSWRLGALVLERTYARSSTEELRRATLDLVMGDADDLRPAVQQVQRDNFELARAEPWRVRSFARAAADLVRTLVGDGARVGGGPAAPRGPVSAVSACGPAPAAPAGRGRRSSRRRPTGRTPRRPSAR